MFENRMLRKVFGPRREDVTGDIRKLHVKELYDLCSSQNRPYQSANKMKEKR